MNSLTIIFSILSIISIGNAAKILCVFPAAAHSHYTIGYSLAKGLAARGHQVTFASPFEAKETIQNLKIVFLEDVRKHTEGKVIII